jgi:tetratricopeptide (TPR) repeat protein
MNDTTCSGCGTASAINSLYDLNGKVYCGACLKPAIDAAKAGGQPAFAFPLANKLICARCNTYLSEGAPFVQSKHLRFCEPCGAMVKDWKYPRWLQLSFAGLMLLLVVALGHGSKYFAAGKSLYLGERLVEQGKYAEALTHLQKALNVAPASDKAALLTAKAALLSGHPEIASKALEGHNNGYFADANDPQFQEVKGMWERAGKALEELEKAGKLADEEGHEAEAAQLVHAAAADYPQFPNIAVVLNVYDGGKAFAKKDYDTFLSLAARNWDLQQSAGAALSMASALDCKYAVTGDTQYRTRSEDMMAKARKMAVGNKEMMDALAEFEDRHKYRLETRKIITKNEYDRRFRNAMQAEKKK